MFCLVRTASNAKPQFGITFLLVDMASAGISVRPILSLAGDHEFNEVHFRNVRVPMENRVGDENDGWSVAKQLMGFARANNTTSGLLRRALRRAEGVCDSHGGDSLYTLTLHLRELECELIAFETLEHSLLARADAARSSMLKTIATELHQKMTTVALEAAGPAALALSTPSTALSPWLEDGGLAGAKYLATRAASIYSGTNETHRNVMAHQLLGL
jgi:acyl-CoA dehydrogenase